MRMKLAGTIVGTGARPSSEAGRAAAPVQFAAAPLAPPAPVPAPAAPPFARAANSPLALHQPVRLEGIDSLSPGRGDKRVERELSALAKTFCNAFCV
jgi:hypothetical protein